jgi:transposase InsO family protein
MHPRLSLAEQERANLSPRPSTGHDAPTAIGCVASVKLTPVTAPVVATVSGIKPAITPTITIVLNRAHHAAVIDSGAAVSIIPPHLAATRDSLTNSMTITTATGAEIQQFGQATMTFTIPKLRRQYVWTFVVAAVKNAILGWDFLTAHGITINARSKSICDDTQITRHVRVERVESLTTSTTNVPDYLKQFASVFGTPQFNQKVAEGFEFSIDTGDTLPIASRFRRLTPERLVIAKREFETLLQAGIISPSKSPWSSPLHMAPKQDQSVRPCGDYRLLNNATRRDAYPLPHIHDFTALLAGATVFSKIDLVKAYHIIPIRQSDREKTAITTPFGLYEYNRMPFGLKNSAACFQRYIHAIVHDLDNTYAYVDDIIVGSATMTEHIHHLQALFKQLTAHGLNVSAKKCDFAKSSLTFLGIQVDQHGISPPQSRVDAIRQLPTPSTYAELRSRLGAINYYRRFIPRAASICQPLQLLLKASQPTSRSSKSNQPLAWSKQCDDAYQQLLTVLQQRVTLSNLPPNTRELILTSDASDSAIGAVLEIDTPDGRRPVGFYSRALTTRERVKPAFDRELLALAQAIKHFRHLLESMRTIAYTDHQPLVSAITKRTDAPSRWQASQLAYIAEYADEVRHVSGQSNVVADALSRVQSVSCEFAIDLPSIINAQVAHKIQCPEAYNKLSPIQHGEQVLHCDDNGSTPRPFVPPDLREHIIRHYHELGHSGNRTTTRLINARFHWPTLKVDVQRFCQTCLTCQRTKIDRHTKVTASSFHLPCNRFDTVHVDVVGPLPSQKGTPYLLTMIDRATNWVEATPMVNTTADETARTFLSTWISRFGVPLHIITDQGRNFESELMAKLQQRCGFLRLRTTAYHPQTNGKIERMHRTLKAMLRVDEPNWEAKLPSALLALRIMPHKDDGIAPFTAVTGGMLAIPAGLTRTPQFTPSDLCHAMKTIEAHVLNRTADTTPPSTTFMPPALGTCTHVWLRLDRVRRPLEAPYTGPHQVIARDMSRKTMFIDQNGTNTTVSMNRTKPVTTNVTLSTRQPPNTVPPATIEASTSPEPASSTATTRPTTTRSGRTIKFRNNNEYHYY